MESELLKQEHSGGSGGSRRTGRRGRRPGPRKHAKITATAQNTVTRRWDKYFLPGCVCVCVCMSFARAKVGKGREVAGTGARVGQQRTELRREVVVSLCYAVLCFCVCLVLSFCLSLLVALWLFFRCSLPRSVPSHPHTPSLRAAHKWPRTTTETTFWQRHPQEKDVEWQCRRRVGGRYVQRVAAVCSSQPADERRYCAGICSNPCCCAVRFSRRSGGPCTGRCTGGTINDAVCAELHQQHCSPGWRWRWCRCSNEI